MFTNTTYALSIYIFIKIHRYYFKKFTTIVVNRLDKQNKRNKETKETHMLLVITNLI